MRKKKLLYVSLYRGSKETDILIGGFARIHLPNMNTQEMNMWEDILKAEDALIYQWLVMNKKRPESCHNAMGNKLKTFVENRWAQ